MRSEICRRFRNQIIVVLCAIWYHSYNSKNVKNTDGAVLLLVKLQALAFMGVFHVFKIVHMVLNRAIHHNYSK